MKTLKELAGAPAFPQRDLIVGGELINEGSSGMSMRDYFAAQAMLGIMASRGKHQLMNSDIANNISGMSYSMADAMLKRQQK